ncbi:DNA-directed RNA polymerase II subunit 1 [Panicum miliaceum]|uniref:DNA-directed RNA polymerase n=1 Tax=Panicum miliaceum TaxID=4540 RepID=A0A3L6PKR5_PANMI|nr:DNA-directed RNA polymerase II subunit 1 [Panicum miliaceum]
MRCSFEETVDILLDAAVYAECDYLKGVTENIMLGQLAPIGTGGCTLFLNDQMLKQVIELQLPSYLEGDFGMTPAPSPLSGTPYHEGMMSPSYLMSPDFRASPIDTNASFSPYVRHMALSPVPSQGYFQYSGGYNPSPSSEDSYNPISPSYTPVSPIYTPISQAYTPASLLNAPTSTSYSAASPIYSPTTPIYTLTSPIYSQIPSYSPTTPIYNPPNFTDIHTDFTNVFTTKSVIQPNQPN